MSNKKKTDEEILEEYAEDLDGWVAEQEERLFRKKHFESMGVGREYVFQSLTFTGNASGDLSLATTILGNLDYVPEELKNELKGIQDQLHEFQEKLREFKKVEKEIIKAGKAKEFKYLTARNEEEK